MTLFIDVDRTLFDVDAVYEEAAQRNIVPQELALAEAPRFLYPDTREFLQNHQEYQLVLCTFGDEEYQKEKVRRSGIGELVHDALYTGSTMKGEVLANALQTGNYKAPFFFLDDDIMQLQSVREEAPDITLVKIERVPDAGTEWDGFRVADLDEFAKIIATYDRE